MLLNNINKMYEFAVHHSQSNNTVYMTHAAIIQSSGSGKSRMVDEVAKTKFTIPINIRAPIEEGKFCLSTIGPMYHLIFFGFRHWRLASF